jgi:hypothetical protein
MTIEDCLWNRSYFVVVTNEEIFLHEIHTLRQMAIISHFPGSNSIALSDTTIPTSTTANHFLLFATPKEVGNLTIFDCKTQKVVNKIQAHRSELEKIAINTSCSMLATSSKMGTIIRVFRIPSGEIHASFRIHNFPISIQSLSFCEKSIFLLCLSNYQHSQVSVCLVDDRYKEESLIRQQRNQQKLEQKQLVNQLIGGVANVTVGVATGVAHAVTGPAHPNYIEEASKEGNVEVLEDEDEDGFCTVVHQPEEEQYNSLTQDALSAHNQGGQKSSDARSVAGNTYAGNTAVSSSSSVPPTAPTTTLFSSIFNRKNAQSLLDASMDGLQKIRSYSQELFVNNTGDGVAGIDGAVAPPTAPATSSKKRDSGSHLPDIHEDPEDHSPQERESIGNPEQARLSHGSASNDANAAKKKGASVSVHIDKKIVRPVFQASVPGEFKDFVALLKYRIPNHRNSKDDTLLHYDDDGTSTIASEPYHELQPNQSQSSNEELKFYFVSKHGVYRK